jgi:hypothetical protein
VKPPVLPGQSARTARVASRGTMGTHEMSRDIRVAFAMILCLLGAGCVLMFLSGDGAIQVCGVFFLAGGVVLLWELIPLIACHRRKKRELGMGGSATGKWRRGPRRRASSAQDARSRSPGPPVPQEPPARLAPNDEPPDDGFPRWSSGTQAADGRMASLGAPDWHTRACGEVGFSSIQKT